MANCKNCNNIITGKFCSTCGQAVSLKRIDSHYITHEIQHLLHFEKGILFTVKQLLIRPGYTIREFITDNRNKLIKPIPFIIVASVLYTLIDHYFHIGDYSRKQIDSAYAKSAVNAISHWVQGHFGYANIIMGIFIAVWIKLFFRKSGYNIFEITILLCFVMGMGMLLLSIAAFFVGVLHLPQILLVATVVIFIYVSWGIGQFFDGKKILNYVKALLAYLLGFFTFKYAILAIGLTCDYFFK